MWATAIARLHRHWLEGLWALFVAANVALMFFVAQWETIPFHNVWVSLALLYCVRFWALRVTVVVLLGVAVVTGAALAHVVLAAGAAGYDELAELPMMAAMFLVTVVYSLRRQEAIDELRRTAERERDFIRDVSHHLRTPITIALGHAELIRASTEDSQLADDAELVIEELKRVATISDRLLLLASAEDGRFLAREPVDVSALVQDTARRWTGAAPRQWEVSAASEGVLIADEERLALALDCLIENALKATSQDDTIAIKARTDGDGVLFEVSDSGRGIRPEDQERIFDRFERSPEKGSLNGGAGLGLALVKAIAEGHGGSVEVESELGRGSTFRIRLGDLDHAVASTTISPRAAAAFVANRP